MTKMRSSTSSSELAALRKVLVRVVLMAVLLGAAMTPLHFFYDSRIPEYSGYKQHWILDLRQKQYDYTFVGASRVGNNIMPLVIDSILQTDGINLGVGGAIFAENLLLMKEFYAHGNSSRVVLIEATTWMLADPRQSVEHPFSDEKFLHLLGHGDSDSIICANTNSMKHFFRKYLPYFKYAEYNNVYPLDAVALRRPIEPFSYTPVKGYIDFHRYSGEITLNENAKPVDRPVFPESQYALEELIREVRRQHGQVILFTAPTSPRLLPYEKGRKATQDTLAAIALRYHVPYLNFEELPAFTEARNYSGFTHLSKYGAEQFSVFLADTLKNVLRADRYQPHGKQENH